MGQGGSPGGNSYGDAGAGYADGNNDTAGSSNVAKSLKTTAVGGNRSGLILNQLDLVVVLKVQDQMVAVAVEDILEEMEDGLLVVVDLIWS